eukprot:jgi/Botrbrau1/12362/Bobra.0239s0011.1
MGTLQLPATLAKHNSELEMLDIQAKMMDEMNTPMVDSMNMEEYLMNIWDRDQGQANGSETSDVVPAGTLLAKNLSSQTEGPDYRGRKLEEVWQAIQEREGRTTQEPSTGAKKQILPQGNAAPEALRPPVVGRAGYPTGSDAARTLLLRETPVASAEGGLDSGRPAGNANSQSVQINAMSRWAGGHSALKALPHSQDRFLPNQPLPGRNSSPTSSAESHPGSSTADLSHVMCLTSTPASGQDIPNPSGGSGRGSRQRKRKEVEVTDERTLRQQKRMVKNRESAARSRMRKQQYTTSLEVQVAELRKKNMELMEQLMKGPTNTEQGVPVLRRTNTTPARLPSLPSLLDP